MATYLTWNLKAQIRLLKRLLWFFLVLIFCLCLLSSKAEGAGSVIWADPLKITGPGSVNYPDIVVDRQGRIHFFYSQGITKNSNDHAIYYRYLEREVLSSPIDILITPGILDARTPSVVLDDFGVVHLVWVGGSDIWYSQAPVDIAGNATSWSPPILLDGPTASNTRPAFSITAGNQLHLAYITYGAIPGISLLESDDGGIHWNAPIKVTEHLGDGLAPVSLSMCIDQSLGMMHIVWYEGDILSRGLAAQDIYYIRQLDSFYSWSTPDRFDSVENGKYEGAYGPSMPSIACNQSSIYIYWYGAPLGQRHFRFSVDGGKIWNNIGRISDFRGLTYPAGLAFDRNGVLYAASGSLDNRLMFMIYDGQSWSEALPIDENIMGPHYPRMVSQNGQILHVVWHEVATDEIWYRRGVVSDIPALIAITQTPANQGELEVLSIEEFSTSAVAYPQAYPSITNGQSNSTNGQINISPNGIIAISASSVILLMVFVFLFVRNKHGR